MREGTATLLVTTRCRDLLPAADTVEATLSHAIKVGPVVRLELARKDDGSLVEVELSRTALIGFGAVYRAMLVAGWTDTAGTIRETGVAQFWGAEFLFELRSEIGRK